MVAYRARCQLLELQSKKEQWWLDLYLRLQGVVFFLNKIIFVSYRNTVYPCVFCRISQNVPKLNILRFKSNCKKAKIRSFRKILDIRYLDIGTQTQFLKKDRAFHIHAYIKLYLTNYNDA